MWLTALQISAHQRESLGEPSDDMEPIQHVAGVSEVLVDGCLVGLRPVRNNHVDASAPAWPLFDEEPDRAAALRCLTMARIWEVVPGVVEVRVVVPLWAVPLRHRQEVFENTPEKALLRWRIVLAAARVAR